MASINEIIQSAIDRVKLKGSDTWIKWSFWTRAKDVELDSGDNVENVISEINEDIANEITRATNRENEIETALNSEITRAKSAESTLSTNLNNEIARAKNAESTLESKKANVDSPILTGTPTAPTANAGTNNTQIATTAFVQTAVSEGIAASDALIFKGTLGTSGTITTLPTTYKTGWTYRVVTAGTYAGQVCEIGDLVVALIDRSGSNNANSDWCVAQTNIDGAITGIKSGDAYITVSQSGNVVTITHKDVTRSNTTSTASPAHGGTFTAVKSVTSDTKGHITGVDTETVTLPAYSTGTASASGLTKLYTSTGSNTDGSMTQSAITSALGGKASKYEWTAITKGKTWSRICNLRTSIPVIGTSGILSVSFTRANVAVNATFMIASGHNKKCHIIQVNSTGITSFKIRGVANADGNAFIELYDDANSITSDTEQKVHCRFIPLRMDSFITYTEFTDGTTVPDNYVANDALTVNIGAVTASKFVGDLEGNSDTTTALKTPVTINGTTFDGSYGIRLKNLYGWNYYGGQGNGNIFAKGGKNNLNGRGSVTLLITSAGDYGNVLDGTWLVKVSNRGNTARMDIRCLQPSNSSVEFGWYSDDEYFYFGAWCPTYTTGMYCMVLGHGDVDKMSYGKIAKLTTKPDTWTTVETLYTPQVDYLPLAGGTVDYLNVSNTAKAKSLLLYLDDGATTVTGMYHSATNEVIYSSMGFNEAYSSHILKIGSSSGSMYGSGTHFDLDTQIRGRYIALEATKAISSSVSIVTSSDEKVKSFTEDITTDEEKLVELFDIIKPKSYNYKYSKANSLSIGFSAQEIEQAMIDLDIDPEKYGILNIQYGHMLSRGDDEEDGKYYTKFYEISYNDLFNLSLLKMHVMEKEHVARLKSIEKRLATLENK